MVGVDFSDLIKVKKYYGFKGMLPRSKRKCLHCNKKTIFIFNEGTGHSHCKICNNWEVKVKKKEIVINKTLKKYTSKRDLILEQVNDMSFNKKRLKNEKDI